MAFSARRKVVLISLVALLVIGILTIASVSYFYFLTPTEPTARARLYVIKPLHMERPAQPRVLLERRRQYEEFRRTQLAMIKSRSVLQAALDDPEVAQCLTIQSQADPIRWLEDTLKVEFLRDTEILFVSLSGDRRADLPVIVNAIVAAYMRALGMEREAEFQQRVEELERIIEKTESGRERQQHREQIEVERMVPLRVSVIDWAVEPK